MEVKDSSSKFPRLVIDLLIPPWSAACADSSGGATVLDPLIELNAQGLNAAGTKPTQLGRTNDAGYRPLFLQITYGGFHIWYH